MRNNIGYIDRLLRIAILMSISLSILASLLRGPVAVTGIFIIVFLMVTCFSGYCPFYGLFHLNSKRSLNTKAGIYENNHRISKLQ